MMRLFLATLLAAAATVAATRYDGYKVIRITPRTVEQFDSSVVLHDAFLDVVDFWKSPSKVGEPVDMMVSPEHHEFVLGVLYQRGFDVETIHQNLQKDIDDERNRIEHHGFSYTDFNNLTEIYSWMDDLAFSYPNLASVIDIGTSYETRSIKVLRLGNMTGGKDSVWFEAAIHPREWIAPATLIYVTKLFLDNYNVDANVTTILNNLDVYILPVFNVDGYEYTHVLGGDRIWRKTRSKLPVSHCKGVDANRNWNYQWGGGSDVKCFETYQGPHAHSEVELTAVTSYLLSLGSKLKAFVDFHAYGNKWLLPWGYTEAPPPLADHSAQQDLAQRAVQALTAVYGTQYEVGPISTVMYIATGCSVDWVYGYQGVLQAHAVEGRGNSFLIPPSEIEPSAIETFEAIKVISLDFI